MSPDKQEVWNEKFISRIIDSMADGVFTMDNNGLIASWNKSMEKISGYSALEAVGQTCALLSCSRCFGKNCPTDIGRCKILEKGSSGAKECQLQHKDGHDVPIIKHASVVKDDNGNVLGVVETVTDITELNRARELLDAIVEFAQQRTPFGSMAYFFFDEIQSVPHWEKWIHKALTGVQTCVYILTGSNASMLSGELATALTGRHRVYELFPFNWSEFEKACEKCTLEKYLQLGGFPVAVTDTDPMGYLKELFRDIVLRDIAPRVKTRSPKGLLQVISAVYQSVGAELSLRRIANSAGVSTDTVSQYLEACEQAYLIFSCPFFSYSQRQSSHRQQKYYAIDTGLRFAVSGTTGRDLGKSLENLVFLTLRRRGLSPAYWRNRGEVDFVATVNNKLFPMQVTWEGAVERHYQALDEFYTQYPFAEEAVLIDASNAVAFVQNCNQFLG